MAFAQNNCMTVEDQMDEPSAEDHLYDDFEKMVIEFEAPLLRYASRLLNQSRSAEDVVQMAFLKLHKAWQNGTLDQARVSSWLYRVTHNAAIDYLRKESRRGLLHRRHREEFQLTRQTTYNGSGPEVSDAAARAAEQLKRLSPKERQVVILKVYEEMSYKEISAITGHSEGNVGYILHHALKKMASGLKEANVIAEKKTNS